uniref:P2Y purinoceptor 2 n=1 Tax=Pundamilia nyererei TaxID=303518 RepID=A0A3B4GF75_9CICH
PPGTETVIVHLLGKCVNPDTMDYCQFNDDFKYILLPVSYTLVFVIGLALNATALYVIVFRTKRWKPSTIYMFNLTVCDTLYIFTLPFLIYYYADKNDWPFSEPFCKLIRFLFYANLYGSILFLSCISLHRFVGICYPVRSLNWVSARQARLVSVAVWACVLFCQAPILYFSRTRDVNTERICHDTTSPELFDDFLVYSSVVSVLMFVLPFMVVMVCYGLMVRKLLDTGLTAQRSKQKSVKMIIIVLAAFMLCFLPFHLTRSLYYFFRYMSLVEASSVAYKITRPLASANSCVDPILYFLAGQDARSNLTKKRKLPPPKANSGIQNLTPHSSATPNQIAFKIPLYFKSKNIIQGKNCNII